MYLSQLLINVGDNPDRPDWNLGRRWLRNRYRVHQRLCMAFPSQSRKTEDAHFLKPYDPADFRREAHVRRTRDGGFLYRIDLLPGDGALILVQSAAEPDWDYAFHNADFLLKAPPRARDFAPTYAAGETLRFRLVANPTKRLPAHRTGGKTGLRVGIYEEEAQRSWLERKADDGGFHVTDCQVLSEGKVHSGKPADRSPRDEVTPDDKSGPPAERAGRKPDWVRMGMLSVRFDGVLHVTDPDLFLKTLQSGIGSGKAFGFGLLSVARA